MHAWSGWCAELRLPCSHVITQEWHRQERSVCWKWLSLQCGSGSPHSVCHWPSHTVHLQFTAGRGSWSGSIQFPRSHKLWYMTKMNKCESVRWCTRVEPCQSNAAACWARGAQTGGNEAAARMLWWKSAQHYQLTGIRRPSTTDSHALSCRAVPDYLHWHCTDMECVWWPSCCIPLRQHSSSRHRYRPTEWKSSCHPAAPTAPPQTHNLTLRHFCELAWISEFLLQLGGSLKTPNVRMTPNKVKGWIEPSPKPVPTYPQQGHRADSVNSAGHKPSRAQPSRLHAPAPRSEQPCCARARMHADLKIKVRTGASCDSSSVPQQVAEVWVTGSRSGAPITLH